MKTEVGGGWSLSANGVPTHLRTALAGLAALLSFVSSGPSNGGLRVRQSSTQHHYLGAQAGEDAVAVAVRGY